jgi:heat shock protein HtpX
MGNQIRTALLLAAMTACILIIGQLMGGRQGLILALFLAGAMNFFSYWYSDKLVLRMYRAKEVGPSQAPDLHALVSRLAQRAGLPMPKVFVIPQKSPNAFATGRDPEHAVVAVTEGLLQIMDRGQLEGVLAHELGHVKNRDILIGTIAATMAGAVMMLASMARWSAVFGGGRRDEGGGGAASGLGLILMSILAPLAAVIIQMAISRSREYLADDTGAAIAGTPEGLAGALEKLGAYARQIPMEANPSTAHMFIVSPLTGRSLQTLFATHPPVAERVARLRGQPPTAAPPTAPSAPGSGARDEGRAFWDRLSGDR